MKKDLTRGSITAALCSFAAPMILGNLLQQAYNLGDTLVVGRCLGDNAAQSENHRRYIITQKKRRRSKKVPAHFLFEIVTFVTIFCPARPPAYCRG